MGKSRSERRASTGAILNLYPPETTLGWRIIGHTTVARAAEKVARGHWREVLYEDGSLAGFQILATFKTEDELPTNGYSPCTITESESDLNAGTKFEHGKSQTAGRPEWKRISRHARYDDKKILAPEDAIERAVEKVRRWPWPANRAGTDEDGKPIFGDRAVRVYPKPG
jgi:hypothetical protein